MMNKKPTLPLQELLDSAPVSTLGDMPPEATFATIEYCIEGDEMPEFSEAVEVLKNVPATLIEVPVEIIKAVSMSFPDMVESFTDFEGYHRWYKQTSVVPVYGAENRWPCIASLLEDELVQDGNHRLHAYINAGHETIPVLRYDYKAWWKAHARWKQKKTSRLPAARQN